MAGITLVQAEAQLALYLAAEAAVLLNQSYSINGRSLTRADLSDIQAGIATWQSRVKALSATASRRSRTRYVVPGS